MKYGLLPVGVVLPRDGVFGFFTSAVRIASVKAVCVIRPCSCAYRQAPHPHPWGGVTRTNGDTSDIGVPFVELTADPGALEKDGVLTADVEVDVMSMGECESVSRS